LHSVIKQASDLPDIAFGTAGISLHTDRNSALGHFLPVRGVYASAHMQVTVSQR